MHLKKKFGQHFLKDPANAKRISDAVKGWGGQYTQLIEIGPGGGVLTKFLVQNVSEKQSLTLVEIDRDLIEGLTKEYLKDGLSIDNIDFLKADLRKIPSPFGVCGNFPYNISSQILFRILEYREHVPEMVGMFQKEVAQRVVAGHGNKTYGILSVLVQAYFKTEVVFTLKPGAFNPPPKVDSMVIRLERFRDSIPDLNEASFFKLVKAAFGQRRKTLRNSLANFLGEKKNDENLDAILRLRAEQLSVEDFIELAKKVLN